MGAWGNSAVYLLDLETNSRSILAHHALFPVISWPWAGWRQVTNADASGHEQFENLLTHQQVALNDYAWDKVLIGTSYVYQSAGDTDPNATNFTYIPDITQPDQGRQTYTPNIPDGVNSLTFNGRYIGWHSLGNGEPPQVYDVQHRQIILLPTKDRPVPTETTNVTPKAFIWVEDPNASDISPDPNHQQPVIFSFMAIPGS